jgi:hypothetical protein
MENSAFGALREAFAFPFRGPDWRERFIVGSVLVMVSFFVPILPLVFVCGYALAVMRRAIQGEQLLLPRWGDWGRLGLDGLRAMVAGFVYLLPGLAVGFVGFAVYFAATFATPFAVEAGNESLWLFLFFGAFVVMFVTLFLGTMLTLLGAIPLPLATAQFVDEDDLAAAFRFRQWWQLLRANPLGVFIAWVVVAGLMAILYLLVTPLYYTLVLCCAVPLLAAPVLFYVLLVGAAVFGLAYRESLGMVADGRDRPTL